MGRNGPTLQLLNPTTSGRTDSASHGTFSTPNPQTIYLPRPIHRIRESKRSEPRELIDPPVTWPEMAGNIGTPPKKCCLRGKRHKSSPRTTIQCSYFVDLPFPSSAG